MHLSSFLCLSLLCFALLPLLTNRPNSMFLLIHLLALTGPDICGPSTKKVHVIFNYKGKNHLINKDIRCKVRLQETVLLFSFLC